MDGYEIYIWSAYLIAAIVILGIWAQTIVTMRQRERTLNFLRRDRRRASYEEEKV